jgi:site-specific DNA-methyltransferase (adenine-specific)
LACAIEDAGFEIRDQLQWLYGSGFPKSLDVSKAMDKAAGAERRVVGTNPNWRAAMANAGGTVLANRGPGEQVRTEPATELSQRWAGWGTALKPSHEPIVLARKPLIGTVAANVATHGTGAINVDGCRVEGGERSLRTSDRRNGNQVYGDGLQGSRAIGETSLGRWPANVILDSDAAALLDAQSGERKAGGKVTGRQQSRTGQSGIYGHYEAKENSPYYDTGGASRFFYCAKASRAERNAGLAGMPESLRGTMNDYAKPSEGRTAPKATGGPQGNHHPTVKPVALMRWLVRLITPPGGTVLDPFLGSGTTGIASATEGFRFIGIEQDAEYLEIARRRIAHWTKAPDLGPLFAQAAD